MAKRWPIKEKGDSSVLNESIQFPTSKKVAKNRLLKPPMTESMSTWDSQDMSKSGFPTQQLINVYEKWSLGGFGLLVTGNVFVDPNSVLGPEMSFIHPNFDSYERKNAFRKSANALKRGGGLAIAQLSHGGRLTPIKINPHPWAPSSIRHESKVKIKEIPPEKGFIVGIKVNTHEFGNKDFPSDEVVKICQEFDKLGFDFIELSGGTVEQMILNADKIRESTKNREAFFQEYSRQIKPAVKNVKLYLTGGLRTVCGMNDVINSGIADGVGIGRPCMAEPDIAKKILSGEVQSVAYNVFEDSYMFYMMSSLVLLNQAAATSVDETGDDLTSGMSDYSQTCSKAILKISIVLKMIPKFMKRM
uniref:NADH:flavin oxidoreductase/NADH oxidase N-terminal domain-containing protein n=1 Tax=Acrobeloides nanus TaxID=290746 RepID=A0A914C4H5_9BILA